MKERPILFSAPMVLAILEGRKTQTRRVVKPQPVPEPARASWFRGNEFFWESNSGKVGIFHPEQAKCPYGQPRDALWVKETWRVDGVEPPPGQFTKRLRVRYRADDARIWFEQGEWPSGSVLDPEHWTPSIHMPRWASRITLVVTAVRVDRLQNISDEDALAEGIDVPKNLTEAFERGEYLGHRNRYMQLWDSINGQTHPWASNPWVWVIEFRRIKP